MAEGPACTLLHLGPGYGDGIANLHNARRAHTPTVNVIGDHATYHRRYDAPLNSDIPALVAPNSIWARSAESAHTVAALTAQAVAASCGPPGGPMCLILPADAAWSETRTEKSNNHSAQGYGVGERGGGCAPPDEALPGQFPGLPRSLRWPGNFSEPMHLLEEVHEYRFGSPAQSTSRRKVDREVLALFRFTG